MSKTIMIVENSESIRELIAFTLKQAGYEVLESENGQKALKQIEEGGVVPDMIFTDLHMPIMNGIELTKQLRKNPRFRFLPIMLVTTEYQDEKKQEGKAAGASGWIIKPFKPDQLIKTVKKFLD